MTTTENLYPHLDEKAQKKLELTDDARIRAIREGTWLALPHVKEALTKLEDLREYPKVTRMPCMLIIGPSFSGKTSIVEHFVSLHPPDLTPENETTTTELIMIDAPPKPDLSDFYGRILDKLMAAYKPRATAAEKYSQVKRLFRELGVKVLIVDEIHHLIAGSLNKQREFRNALKSLSNEAKVCIVAVGIEEAQTAFNADPQMASRFVPFELPMWHLGKDLGILLKTLEKRTPLKKPSYLHSTELMNAIHARSESNLGDIFDLMKTAAVDAIRSGQECITEKQIKGLDWVPPSKRKIFHRKR